MSRNSEVLSVLADIGVPVSYQHYSGDDLLYVTFFLIDEGEAYSGDNEEKMTWYYLQVDIWNKPTVDDGYANYLSLEKTIRSKLKAIGYRRTGEYDLFETDTKIQHHAMRFKKLGAPDL